MQKGSPLISDTSGRSVVEIHGKAGDWCLPPSASMALDLGSDLNPWPLDSSDDVWEALGSDHNSGFFLYGDSSVVSTWWNSVLPKALMARVDDVELECGAPCAARWDFGRTSLAIVFGDEDGQAMDIDGLHDSLPDGCVGSIFGAYTDDMLLHEILGQALNESLPDESKVDPDDVGDSYSDLPFFEGVPAISTPSGRALVIEAYCALFDGVLSKKARRSAIDEDDGNPLFSDLQKSAKSICRDSFCPLPPSPPADLPDEPSGVIKAIAKLSSDALRVSSWHFKDAKSDKVYSIVIHSVTSPVERYPRTHIAQYVNEPDVETRYVVRGVYGSVSGSKPAFAEKGAFLSMSEAEDALVAEERVRQKKGYKPGLVPETTPSFKP